MKKQPLPPSQLYKSCNITQLKFSSTEELEDIDIAIGQERAIEAIKFGIRIKKNGYNIFALGPEGTGKLCTVKQLAEHEACRQPIPFDWCYVHNFNHSAKPAAIRLEPGQGKIFQQDMAELMTSKRCNSYRIRRRRIPFPSGRTGEPVPAEGNSRT